MKTITITLDEYEVSNLRELLRCCGVPYDEKNPPPFEYNTGDWLGQLFWKLEPLKTEHKPNVSIEQVIQREQRKTLPREGDYPQHVKV